MKIRVCVINPNYYRSSGITKTIGKLFEFSKKENIIDWYFIDCRYDVKPSLNMVYDIHKYQVLELMSLNPITLSIGIYKLLIFIRKNKIKIVHLHHRRLFFLLGYILKINDVKVVYTAHLTYKFNVFFYFSKADKLVAVTESVKRNIYKTLRYNKNISVISNPVDFQDDFRAPILENKKNIVSIGRLEKVKNFSNLINAWAISSAPAMGYRLYIIGEGSQYNELKDLIANLQVDDSVFLSGFVNNIFEVFKDCYFNVLVSFLEGQGIVTIEAATQKIPTLLSKVDGSIDCIPTNLSLPNGINPYSIYEIKMCIDTWINNPELVENDGRMFYEYMKCKAITSKVYEEYLDIYKILSNES